jgi:hypothetical protein
LSQSLRARRRPAKFFLDVRTAEELDQGHLEVAVIIDFYGTDFGTRRSVSAAAQTET